MRLPGGRSGSRVLLGFMVSSVLPHLHLLCDGSAVRGRDVGGGEEES